MGRPCGLTTVGHCVIFVTMTEIAGLKMAGPLKTVAGKCSTWEWWTNSNYMQGWKCRTSKM